MSKNIHNLEAIVDKIENAISLSELLEIEKKVKATNYTDLDSEYLLSIIDMQVATFN
jgi:hypothetical protein